MEQRSPDIDQWGGSRDHRKSWTLRNYINKVLGKRLDSDKAGMLVTEAGTCVLL